MSTQTAPPQGNGGSRESSEFEFVNVQNRSALAGPPPVPVLVNNPLLLSSNQPAPGPGIITTPTSPQSVTVRASLDMDQTKVATVKAESPPPPGMFGWVKGSGFLSKVVEKTKSVTENVITTLDPQMKEWIHSGGDVEVEVPFLASLEEVLSDCSIWLVVGTFF